MSPLHGGMLNANSPASALLQIEDPCPMYEIFAFKLYVSLVTVIMAEFYGQVLKSEVFIDHCKREVNLFLMYWIYIHFT